MLLYFRAKCRKQIIQINQGESSSVSSRLLQFLQTQNHLKHNCHVTISYTDCIVPTVLQALTCTYSMVENSKIHKQLSLSHSSSVRKTPRYFLVLTSKGPQVLKLGEGRFVTNICSFFRGFVFLTVISKRFEVQTKSRSDFSQRLPTSNFFYRHHHHVWIIILTSVGFSSIITHHFSSEKINQPLKANTKEY